MKLIAFLATAQPERARRFYEETLQLRFVADEQFALVFESGGVEVRIQKVDQVKPAGRTVLGWEVEDIGAELARLGVEVERYEFAADDGIWTAPSGARVAWFTDPDGNILSLTERP